jgi:hypothetical protein
MEVLWSLLVLTRDQSSIAVSSVRFLSQTCLDSIDLQLDISGALILDALTRMEELII